jgi:O-antigen/teichoic acid export membrane protein
LNLAAHLAASIRLVKNRSVRAAGTYFASTLINALVPLLLLPVMTRLMDPSDYGRAAMFQSICYIASTLSGFAMRTPLLRFFAISGRAERRDYLASNIAISGLLAAVTVLMFLVAMKPISELTGLSVFWVILATLTGVVATLSQIYLTVLQTDDRALSYSLFQIGITMANIGISLVLMIACSLSWQGRNLGVVLSTVIGAVFAMSVLMWRHDIGRVKREYVMDSLTLGAAGMPHTFANALISYADRFFLSGAYSMSQVGLYSVSSRLAQGYYFLTLGISSTGSHEDRKRCSSPDHDRRPFDGADDCRGCSVLSLCCRRDRVDPARKICRGTGVPALAYGCGLLQYHLLRRRPADLLLQTGTHPLDLGIVHLR